MHPFVHQFTGATMAAGVRSGATASAAPAPAAWWPSGAPTPLAASPTEPALPTVGRAPAPRPPSPRPRRPPPAAVWAAPRRPRANEQTESYVLTHQSYPTLMHRGIIYFAWADAKATIMNVK